MRVVPVIGLFVLASFIACGSSSSKPVEPTTPAAATPSDQPVAAATPPTPPAPSKATFPGLPETLAGEHVAWILHAIAKQDGVVALADVERRLHPTFLAAVPADQFVDAKPSCAGGTGLAT